MLFMCYVNNNSPGIHFDCLALLGLTLAILGTMFYKLGLSWFSYCKPGFSNPASLCEKDRVVVINSIVSPLNKVPSLKKRMTQKSFHTYLRKKLPARTERRKAVD